MATHALLQSQLRKSTRPDGSVDLDRLGDLVSEAYAETDRDRRRTERTIDLMVQELDEVNANLEALVAQRTDELKSVRISLDATLQNTAQGILVIDETGRITASNDRVLEMLDLPAELLEKRPPFVDVLRFQWERGEFDFTEDSLRAWIADGGIRNSPPIYERARPNGRILEVRTVMLASGGAVRTFTDITEVKSQWQALQQAERLHRSLFENAAAGLYRAALDGTIINANLSLAQLYGFSSVAEFVALANSKQRWRSVEPGRRDSFRKDLFANGRVVDFVCELENPKTRRRVWISETAWLVRDPLGEPAYYEGSVTDISVRKASEDRMAYMAMHDALTGLPNRAFLMHWLASEKGTAALDRQMAIHCIDLDRFKEVNDDLGHASGDQLLKCAAQRMERALRNGDFAVRLGGDEFAVVQLGTGSLRAVTQLADRLIRVLSEDYNLCGKTASIGASIGSACNLDEETSGEHLLKSADIALYRAKSIGGSCYRLYDAELDAEHARRRMIETSLRSALAENQFSLVFQPILSLRDNTVGCYEALIRWHHPVEGMISPAEFIPLAEQCEVINALGEWVLRQACQTFAEAGSGASVSVNLSPAQLRQRGFVRTVVNTLASTGLAPDRLTLEITETVLLSDNATTRAQLKELRALGVKIALDDFGSGHSSLAYLKSYDFDKIKIDRSFIAGRRRNRVNSAVINAVIGLGRDLGIEVIAEGIETEEQLRDLTALGCDSIQGYLIGMPKPVTDWPQLMPLAHDIEPPLLMSA